MNTPFKFSVTAYASNGVNNGVSLGTEVELTGSATVEHVLSVYDRTTGVDLAVFPFDAKRCPLQCDDGALYPIFTYRSGRESMLTRPHLRDLLQSYVDGEVLPKDALKAA